MLYPQLLLSIFLAISRRHALRDRSTGKPIRLITDGVLGTDGGLGTDGITRNSKSIYK